MTNKKPINQDCPPPQERPKLSLPAHIQIQSRYASSDLFKGQSEIQIEHQGAEYRLRITRSGGLILNK